MSSKPQYPKVEDEGKPPIVALVVWGLIAIGSLLFIFQNTGSTNFHFLFFDFEFQMWVFMLILLAAGVGLDRLGMFLWARRKKKKANEKAAEKKAK